MVKVVFILLTICTKGAYDFDIPIGVYDSADKCLEVKQKLLNIDRKSCKKYEAHCLRREVRK